MTAARAIGAIVLAVGFAGAAMAATHTFYDTGNATCDGWPRAPIKMADGFCAGVVVSPSPAAFRARTLRLPRMLIPLRGDRDWLVVDLGDWDSHRGKVFKLTADRGKAPVLTPLLTGLVMPHGIARGPDGNIYVGEMNRIFRFDPNAASPQSTIEPVVTGLPHNELHENRHPLSAFIFDANGDLLVNVGAPSDECTVGGKPNGTTSCRESEGDEATAGLRRYSYLGDGRWSARFTMFVRGLRNSVALVRHSSGTLLQGENSIDFPSIHSPFDEINVLRAGAHYGWPYCYDMDQTTPAWAGSGAMDCRSAAHTKPVRLLPPHAAPLDMRYYNGAMFPQLRGNLLMTWHGYQRGAARIAAYAVDDRGVPVLTPRARYDVYANATGDKIVRKAYPGAASEPLLLTPGWNRVDGERPMGAPVALAIADDLAIWVTEDRNSTILRIAVDRP